MRAKVPGIPEDGKIPRSSMITIGVMSLAAVSASLWWTFARGSDEIQGGTYSIDEFQTAAASTASTPTGASIELGDDGSLHPTGQFETLPVDTLVLALGPTSRT